MRSIFLVAVALSTAALPALGQTAPTAASPTILYGSPADLAAAVARAKSLPNMVPQFLVAFGGYSARIEFRRVPTPASLHEKDDELLEVIEGSGTIVVGGTLKDSARRDASNLNGSGVEGGQSYEVTKGSFFLFPAGVPHYFAKQGSEGLTIITVHVPHGAEFAKK